MKKVLMVAYGFPPVGGAGVQRPVKFVKYLREFGWEPVVLTVANPSVPVIDESLMKDIPEGVKIYKARSFEPSYQTKKQFSTQSTSYRSKIKLIVKNVAANFLLPDIQVLWWPSLIRTLISTIRYEQPDCLFVTAPPFSSFVPVVIIGKLFRVPVVIDFRDDWSFSRQQLEQAIKSPLAFRLDSILETFTVKHCSQITAANASYVTSLRKLYLTACKDKGVVITNGYDADDFKEITTGTNDGRHVTIVYAGTVWNATSLQTFSLAVKKIICEHPQMVPFLKIKIFGRVVGNHIEYLTDQSLNGVVQLYGYQDHTYIIREMCSADVLLLTLADLPGADKIIAGKVFECMATGKHIFAVISDGEMSHLLTNNYNKVSIAGFGKVDEIFDELLWIMTNIKTVRSTIPLPVNQFSRRCLSEKLGSVFDSVVGGMLPGESGVKS